MIEPKKDREIEPELLYALGQVVVSWSAIEAIIAEFLSFMLAANPAHMYVLNQTTSVEMQSKWIRTLIEIRVPDQSDKDELENLFKEFDEVRRDRNAIVHGLWSTRCEPGAVLVQTMRLDRAEIAREELVTRADLDELIDRIGELRAEFSRIGKFCGFLPR